MTRSRRFTWRIRLRQPATGSVNAARRVWRLLTFALHLVRSCSIPQYLLPAALPYLPCAIASNITMLHSGVELTQPLWRYAVLPQRVYTRWSYSSAQQRHCLFQTPTVTTPTTPRLYTSGDAAFISILYYTHFLPSYLYAVRCRFIPTPYLTLPPSPLLI